MRRILLIIVGCFLGFANLGAQAPIVQKTESATILVHFMPWFEGKEISGKWGSH